VLSCLPGAVRERNSEEDRTACDACSSLEDRRSRDELAVEPTVEVARETEQALEDPEPDCGHDPVLHDRTVCSSVVSVQSRRDEG
jgi:hypothetical protein